MHLKATELNSIKFCFRVFFNFKNKPVKEDEKRFDSDYLNTFQKGFAESDKNEKLPGWFYRCSTESNFEAVFKKPPPFWGKVLGPKFSPFFLLSGICTASRGLVQGP